MANDLTAVAKDSARGSFFLVAGNILATVVQAIGVFVIARLLGPELYGIYTLSFAVPTLLFHVADFGVNEGLIKFSASLRVKGEESKIATLVRNGFLFKLFLALIISCFTILFSDYFAVYIVNRPNISMYIRLASLSILLNAMLTTATSAFVGIERMEYSALITDVQAATKVAVSILLVFLGFTVAGAITGVVVGALAAGLLSAALVYLKLYKTLNPTKENDNFIDSLKILVGYGFPIYISVLLFQVIPEFQSIILSMFTTDADIGNFKASLNFATLIGLLILPMATALFPAFSKLDKDSNDIIKFFRISTKYTTLLIVPLATMVAIFSKEIIEIVYGPQYVSAPTFLSLHITLYLLVGLGYQVQKSFFNGIGETFTTLKIGLITLLLFILLGPFLTMYFSVQGLIIAILTSNTVATIYGAYKAKTKFKIEFPYKSLLSIYCAAIISAAIALLALRATSFPSLPKVAIAVSIYLLCYITLLPITRAITKRELVEAKNATEKIPFVKPLITILLKYEYNIAARLEVHSLNPKHS